MTSWPEVPEPTSDHSPEYKTGYWYNIHGYDWLYTIPIRHGETNTRSLGNDDVDEEELPAHLINSEEVHFIVLDIQYGALDELPQDSGLTSTFAYLLNNYLEAQAKKRALASNARDPEHVPVITVIVGKSYFEVTALSADFTELTSIWNDLAQVFADPKRLYHVTRGFNATHSMTALKETQVIHDAMRYRARHYAGALWHNDVVIRTGLNGASLMPLDVTHSPRRLVSALDVLAQTLNPVSGKTRVGFRTSHPGLMGAAFTQAPQPRSIDDVLYEDDEKVLNFDGGGTLETDDTDALLSVSFPLSLAHMVTAVLLGQIIAQIVHETVGERAVLQADRYVYGDRFVVCFAMGGDWSTEDGRSIIEALLRVPIEGEAILPEHVLAQFIEEFALDGHHETVLYTRRVERDRVTSERVRELLYGAFQRFHVPQPLVGAVVEEVFVPLVEPFGLRVAYGSGDGVAFPPPLEEGDLERDVLEPGGHSFASHALLGAGKYPYLAPHRLSITDEGIIGEWFLDEVVDSALVRRLAVRWRDVRAWLSIGEATALMDMAGRVLFVVPTLYDDVGGLYSLLAACHDRVKSRVLNVSGGEVDLRYRVREMVAMAMQMKLGRQVKETQLDSDDG